MTPGPASTTPCTTPSRGTGESPLGLTLSELALCFGRSGESLRVWLSEPGAPDPVGLRASGRRLAKEYDPDAVGAFLRATGRLPEPAEPAPEDDALLTLREAATHAGVEYTTAKSYVNRGQWPGPDVPAGANGRGARWRRSSIDRARADRKRMS